MTATITEVCISAQAAELIQLESMSKWPHETGGIALGSFEGSRVRIHQATHPGPNAKHGLASFVRDGDFSQQELERVFSETKGSVDYIGEWHSHTLNVGPSPRDRRSMEFIAKSSQYSATNPVLLLALPRGLVRDRTYEIQAFAWVASKLVQVPVIKEF